MGRTSQRLKEASKNVLAESTCCRRREGRAVVSSHLWSASLKYQTCREKGGQRMASGSQVGISGDPLFEVFIQHLDFLPPEISGTDSGGENQFPH